MKYFSWKHLVYLGALVLLVLHPSRALACDPLGCLIAGKDQDMLALVTVTEVQANATAEATPEHVYEHPFFQFAKNSFSIQFQDGAPWVTIDPKLGAHYFVSLKCAKDVCVPKWGAWEVDGVDFRTAKLVTIRGGDDAAVQWIMNEKGSDFYGIEEKMFARTALGDYEIYPEFRKVDALGSDGLKTVSWILAGILVIALSCGALLGMRLRSHRAKRVE